LEEGEGKKSNGDPSGQSRMPNSSWRCQRLGKTKREETPKKKERGRGKKKRISAKLGLEREPMIVALREDSKPAKGN